MASGKWIGFTLFLFLLLPTVVGIVYYRIKNKEFPDLSQIENWLSKYYAVCLTLLVLGGIGALINAPFKNVFVFLEYVALVTVAAVSTYNYIKTASHLKQALDGDDTKGYKFIYGVLNILAFMAALVLLNYTEFHILSVVCIYVFFSLANITQLKLTTLPLSDEITQNANAAQRDTKKSIFAVFSASWLSDENGPSALGFTVVLLLILIAPRLHTIVEFFIPFLHSVIGEGMHNRIPIDYYEDIKAFAAGAATFHLTLSVLKYAAIIKNVDVTEVALERANWDHNGEIAITDISLKTCASWQWKAKFAIITSATLAVMIFFLNMIKA